MNLFVASIIFNSVESISAHCIAISLAHYLPMVICHLKVQSSQTGTCQSPGYPNLDCQKPLSG